MLNLPQFYGVAFLGVHQKASSRWLPDQSERALYFCYVIKCDILT